MGIMLHIQKQKKKSEYSQETVKINLKPKCYIAFHKTFIRSFVHSLNFVFFLFNEISKDGNDDDDGDDGYDDNDDGNIIILKCFLIVIVIFFFFYKMNTIYAYIGSKRFIEYSLR